MKSKVSTDRRFKPVSLKICESQLITNVDRIPAVKQLCQHIQFHEIAHNQSVYMSDEDFSKSYDSDQDCLLKPTQAN